MPKEKSAAGLHLYDVKVEYTEDGVRLEIHLNVTTMNLGFIHAEENAWKYIDQQPWTECEVLEIKYEGTIDI